MGMEGKGMEGIGNSESKLRYCRDPALPIPYSLFPIPYSLFPIPYSLFPIPYSLHPRP